MAWVGRLFDARDTLARILLLDLSGIGYLVFGAHGGPAATGTQWALAVPAFVLALLCHRRPLLNLLIQAVLLVAALVLVDDVMINQVGASWALLELTMRATRPRTVWLGAGLLAVVDLTSLIGEPVRAALTGLFGLAVTVGLPLLLGTSRKSMIGKVIETQPTERLPGTIASNVIGIMAGVEIIRVHDVAEHVQAARVAEAIRRAR